MGEASKKRCVFCGEQRKLTREHIFPSWMRDFIIHHRSTHTDHFVSQPDGRALHWSRGAMNLTGDPASRRLKIVCGDCNNGWMSVLENSSRPLLEPLIQGVAVDLTPDMQARLAVWAYKTSLMADMGYVDNISTTLPRLSEFYVDRAPPAECGIWVLPIETRRSAHPASSRYRSASNELEIGRVSSFHVGKMSFHVAWGDGKSLADPRYELSWLMTRIWPVTERLMPMPQMMGTEGLKTAMGSMRAEIFGDMRILRREGQAANINWAEPWP